VAGGSVASRDGGRVFVVRTAGNGYEHCGGGLGVLASERGKYLLQGCVV
jgi:hypothetical protein